MAARTLAQRGRGRGHPGARAATGAPWEHAGGDPGGDRARRRGGLAGRGGARARRLLLRHTPGLDRARSNAALPLALHPDPAIPARFYAERGASPIVQVAPLEERRSLDAALVAAGWEERMRVDVLTAPADAIAAPEAPAAVLSSAAPRWLDAWARAEGRGDAALHAEQVFARIAPGRAAYALAPGGASVGVAILTEGGACGLFCMATREDARRRGLAASVLAGLADWARCGGATLLYLQVLPDNRAAQALYARAGFTRSHGYVHRVGPEPVR